MVCGGFGNQPPVKARVSAVERNIKNGMPGIDYTVIDTSDKLWAYLHQVDRVITY